MLPPIRIVALVEPSEFRLPETLDSRVGQELFDSIKTLTPINLLA